MIPFINAGKVSLIVSGFPSYSGSINFSSVCRYFTLSLASFNASVTRSSMALHLEVARYILSRGFPTLSDGVYDAAVKTL